MSYGWDAGSIRYSIKLNQIRQPVETLGFQSENRTFSPHLTLGRIKLIREINPLAELLVAYKDMEFQQQMVKEIILYESRLLPSGAVYSPLRVFELG